MIDRLLLTGYIFSSTTSLKINVYNFDAVVLEVATCDRSVGGQRAHYGMGLIVLRKKII